MFFKMLFLTVLFGVFHGVISLPVLMCCHQKFVDAIFGASRDDIEFGERGAEPMNVAGGDEDNKL